MNFLDTIGDIVSHVEDYWNSIIGIFADIDFSVLYNWLPIDIQGVITAFIGLLVIIAFIGILKKLILFLG